MKTNLTSSSYTKGASPGFASLLTVIGTGMALMIILLMMYKDTIESQKEQKNNLLRNDYQQREQAFLTALTNIIPNKAMRGMMDNATDQTDLGWNSIFQEALIQANAHQALSASESAALGFTGAISANTANTTLSPDNVIKPVFETEGYISSGTKSVVSSSIVYPPLLDCSSELKADDRSFPVISHNKSNGTDHPYGIIPAPAVNFSYKNEDSLIAKHNWWTFKVSFADENYALTHLKRTAKQYLISIYEVPAQLAINSAAYTNFGQHADGSDWSNITTSGGVFAEGVKAKGSFSSDAIASRKGMELADASNPFAADNDNRNKELYEGADSTYSSASDGGRVAFIPINSGTSFFERTLSNTKTPDQNMDSTTAVSYDSTAWDFYSSGANQCVMTFINDTLYYKEVGKTSLTAIDIDDTLESFSYVVSATGDNCIKVDMENLITFLADNIDENNSLCINSDKYVLFSKADDLSKFTNGFSLVANQRLILDGDINIALVEGENYSPPLSMYAPEKRFGNGDGSGTLKIELEGSMGSLAENTNKNNAVEIADLIVNGESSARGADISATLKAITKLEELPPINMMNWMIIVREVHQ